MDSLQQSVKITDGMLRALIQRLSGQVDTMGTSPSTNAIKQLEASLIQVQRVQENLESSLSRVLEHEEATKKAAVANHQTESAESAFVTDRLSKLAAIFGGPDIKKSASDDGMDGDTAISRLEAKLDAATAKFDAVTTKLDEDRKAREGEKIDERLDVLHTTLIEMKHSVVVAANDLVKPASTNNIANGTTQTATTPSAEALSGAPQPSSSDVVGRDRKRKRKDGDERFALPHHVQLSEDHQKKFDELAKIRSVMDTMLGRLLPCPDGGAWDTDRIYELFRSLFSSQGGNMARLKSFMNYQRIHV